jgi:predicted nucleotidyltransferase
MNFNAPIVIWGLGTLVLISGILIAWLDRRVEKNAADVTELKKQMAAHDANKELLDRMYVKLESLADLTQRIAGHLNIS